MTPLPCVCHGPNADCRRAGCPMDRPGLWRLCAGVGLLARWSEEARRQWDGRATNPPTPELVAEAAAKPTKQVKRPPCVHLGPVLPNEKGPCGQRVRKCDEFGRCTTRPCTKAEHHCYDRAGGVACERYEADEPA